jgi:hypothetical protein
LEESGDLQEFFESQDPTLAEKAQVLASLIIPIWDLPKGWSSSIALNLRELKPSLKAIGRSPELVSWVSFLAKALINNESEVNSDFNITRVAVFLALMLSSPGSRTGKELLSAILKIKIAQIYDAKTGALMRDHVHFYVLDFIMKSVGLLPTYWLKNTYKLLEEYYPQHYRLRSILLFRLRKDGVSKKWLAYQMYQLLSKANASGGQVFTSNDYHTFRSLFPPERFPRLEFMAAKNALKHRNLQDQEITLLVAKYPSLGKVNN